MCLDSMFAGGYFLTPQIMNQLWDVYFWLMTLYIKKQMMALEKKKQGTPPSGLKMTEKIDGNNHTCIANKSPRKKGSLLKKTLEAASFAEFCRHVTHGMRMVELSTISIMASATENRRLPLLTIINCAGIYGSHAVTCHVTKYYSGPSSGRKIQCSTGDRQGAIETRWNTRASYDLFLDLRWSERRMENIGSDSQTSPVRLGINEGKSDSPTENCKDIGRCKVDHHRKMGNPIQKSGQIVV